MKEITVGMKVRSFDFAHGTFGRDLEGERACYVEGEVVSIGEVMDGCQRYCIKVERMVFGGREEECPNPFIYPPVNGVRTISGVTDGVEAI